MAYKKTKNELSNMAEDSLKKSDKMQTFVRDFRNAGCLIRSLLSFFF